MSLADAISLVLVCLLGAMVPGASLIVILNTTVNAGVRHGLIATWSHALAVGLYATLTVAGLAVLLSALPALLMTVQALGAAFLAYMAVGLWRSSFMSQKETVDTSAGQSAARGFFIAFLNPKLAIFFLALFSQFVDTETNLADQWLMALIAFLVDGLWYSLVVLGVSGLSTFLQSHSQHLNRLFAVVLLLLAIRLVWGLQGNS